jgi:trimeric autotransporter adhesin
MKNLKKVMLSTITIFVIGSFEKSQAQTTNYGTSSGTYGTNNCFFGAFSGQSSSGSGGKNTFFGFKTGQLNTSGSENIFVGFEVGKLNTTGLKNTFLGSISGLSNTTGQANSFFGQRAGYSNTIGNDNTFFGRAAGTSNITGDGNLYLGSGAGFSNTAGSGNVFIGYDAGRSLLGDSLLVIDNQDRPDHLVYGDFSKRQFGINTNKLATGYTLSVNGSVIATELKIQSYIAWPDYVFKKDYKLLPLQDVENHIKEKGHLPNVYSAKQIEENGFAVSEMNAKLMEKIEELTLYLIEQNKKIQEQDKVISSLKTSIELIKNK